MSTSGLYDFNPGAGYLALTAFERIGLKKPELTIQHLATAAQESNLVQVKLANLQPNLFSSELYTITLTQGTSNYILPARFIALEAVYLTTQYSGSSTNQDRIMWPLSTLEYAEIPNKAQQGTVTSFWYNRISPPQINLWPVPDGNATYLLNIRVCSQIQDVSLASGTQLNVPYRWLDVYVSELAYRLARVYASDKEVMRKQDAKDAWDNAAFEDQERVPLYIGGGESLANYFRAPETR